MGITLKTKTMLWGRAANRCAFAECRRELVIDATQTDDESLIGEVCHIVAESPDGPRGNSPLTLDERNKYSNLVILCAIHHKVVDDQFTHYTIERLVQMKKDHEKWITDTLTNYDPAKQRDDEYYADVIQQFCDRIDVDHWENWSSWVLGGGGFPKIAIDVHNHLAELRRWLYSRIWPGRYPEIESSLLNFRWVLQDFLSVFAEYSEPFGHDMLATARFYKIDEWNPEKYERLSRMHEFHVDLVQDLMFELTRSANFVCDRIRERFVPTFRLREGVLLVTHGPYMDMTYRTNRPEYHGDQRCDQAYPGLEAFKLIREHRDHNFGRGTQP